MTSYQRIHVVINPAAGGDVPVLSILNDVLGKRDVEWDVSITHKAGDCTRLAREAAESGVDVVAAYGGDGTINEAAAGLAGTGVPLMILPGGTNNVLASEFDIPAAIPEAVEQLFSREPRPVDLALVRKPEERNGRYYMMRAEIGITAQMNEETTRELKNQWGTLAYLIGSVRALGKLERVRFHLEVDGARHVAHGVSCQIANTGRLNSRTELKYAPDVAADDGLLDLFVYDVEGSEEGSVAEIVGRTLLHLDSAWHAAHWRGREFQITTPAPTAVWCDGEPFGVTPIVIEVVPDVLHVMSLPAEG